MTESKKTSTDKGPSSVIDVLTGKIGKIGGLVAVIVALLTGVGQIFDVGSKVVDTITPDDDGGGSAPAKCFQPDLVAPETVSFDEWGDMELRLRGTNDCPGELAVHLAFKAPPGSVTIGPTVQGEDCLPAKPDCWQRKKITGSEVNLPLWPPSLKKNVDSFDSVTVRLQWLVYESETGKNVDFGDASIRVVGNGGSTS